MPIFARYLPENHIVNQVVAPRLLLGEGQAVISGSAAVVEAFPTSKNRNVVPAVESLPEPPPHKKS